MNTNTMAQECVELSLKAVLRDLVKKEGLRFMVMKPSRNQLRRYLAKTTQKKL